MVKIHHNLRRYTHLPIEPSLWYLPPIATPNFLSIAETLPQILGFARGKFPERILQNVGTNEFLPNDWVSAEVVFQPKILLNST